MAACSKVDTGIPAGDDGTMESRHPQYWLNLGDWLAPRQNPEKALVHTFCLWLAADITSRTAGVLGFDGDRVRFAALRDSTARGVCESPSENMTCSKPGRRRMTLRVNSRRLV